MLSAAARARGAGLRAAAGAGARRASSSSSPAAAAAPAARHRVLVTGAGGQIGQELVAALRARHGAAQVLATDVRPLPGLSWGDGPGAPAPAGGRAGAKPGAGGAAGGLPASLRGPCAYLDVCEAGAVAAAVVGHEASLVVHLASVLSAAGERAPARALAVNARGTEAVLAAAAAAGAAVFMPSTIAVFGPSTPRDATPNETPLRPTTMYGLTKVYGELLGEYAAAKQGVDFRSLRYPGVISNKAPAGGGTTDYAVDIFYAALRDGRYECFLKPDTPLPMMCVAGGRAAAGRAQRRRRPRSPPRAPLTHPPPAGTCPTACARPWSSWTRPPRRWPARASST